MVPFREYAIFSSERELREFPVLFLQIFLFIDKP